MRLQIQINTRDVLIPYEYHGFLQAAIYKGLSEKNATFYHDKGYGENRLFKMFVFSELMGRYEAVENGLYFLNNPSFFISSLDPSFLNQIYQFYTDLGELTLGNSVFEITRIGPVNDMFFHENNEYVMRTLSPVLCYKTDEKRYKTYFHPKSSDFEISVRENLRRKAEAIGIDPSNDFFEILEVFKAKQVRVKFKRSTNPSYSCQMKIRVSDNYLKLLLHTGMGAKNSAGFGMIQLMDKD